MELKLGDNIFPLRGDILAIKNAQEEHGVRIDKLDGGSIVDVGTMVFHFARRGCEVRRVPFDFDLDGFLGLIEMDQIGFLAEAIGSIISGEKSGPKSTSKKKANKAA